MIDRKVAHSGAGLTGCHVIVLVTGKAGNGKTLHVIGSVLAVLVYRVIYGAFVAFLEYAEPQDVLAYKQFLLHLDHLIMAVAVKYDDIVDGGAVADKLIPLQRRADEALLAVDIQLLVGLSHHSSLDIVKTAYLCVARISLAILLLKLLEPAYGERDHIAEFFKQVGDTCVVLGYELFILLGIEADDAPHLDFKKPLDILGRHLTEQLRLPRLQTLINMLYGSFF